LASTVIGSIGVVLPVSATYAETTSAFPLSSQTASAGVPGGGDLIRPFKFRASDEAIKEMKRRISATRWPSQELVPDASQGVQLATVRQLAQYWQTDYDWRAFEQKMSALPQFVTTIDGVDIHFVHVRSKQPNALPVIVTHGWPGSFIEQLKIIDPLTNPTAFGGSSSDAFDVVIPSLPGHGFSGKPTVLGWNPVRIASAWTVLMKRLGYTRFVAQGGDWGNAVTEIMALQAPPELLGIHTNMPAAVPAEIADALLANRRPEGLSTEESQAYDQLDFFYSNGLGYAQEMSHRPQTMYAIDDSPVGLAAWMLDHDARSYELIARVFAGTAEGLTRDDLLDNITLYWLTNTGVSASRLYWEAAHNVPLRKLAFFTPTGVKIPVAVSAYPDELYTAPKSWAEKAYPKLVHYNRLPKGGHFAAWEQPQSLSEELRASFRPLR
jgi:pimeloyl-ACP methyl ester carboxylesterase